MMGKSTIRMLCGILLSSVVLAPACNVQDHCASHYSTDSERNACAFGAANVAESLLAQTPEVANSSRLAQEGCRKGCVDTYNPDLIARLPEPEFQAKLNEVIREYTACHYACVARCNLAD